MYIAIIYDLDGNVYDIASNDLMDRDESAFLKKVKAFYMKAVRNRINDMFYYTTDTKEYLINKYASEPGVFNDWLTDRKENHPLGKVDLMKI